MIQGDSFEPFAEDVLQLEKVSVAFRTGTQRSQDIHTPNLKRGASLDTGAVDVLLNWGLLTLGLAGMALLDGRVNLRDQSEHEHSFPAEVNGCGDSGMSQELVCRFYDAMAEGMRNVQMADLRAILLAGHSPQLGGGILLKCR